MLPVPPVAEGTDLEYRFGPQEPLEPRPVETPKAGGTSVDSIPGRDEQVKRYRKKVLHACDLLGTTEVARVLGVHVDTVCGWNRGEHAPRDLSSEALLDLWSMPERTMAMRALVTLPRECEVAKDPVSREMALQALALNMGLALREVGGNFDYQVLRNRRPQLTLYLQHLDPIPVRFLLRDNCIAYLRAHFPDGDRLAFDCDVEGFFQLARCMQQKQVSAIKRKCGQGANFEYYEDIVARSRFNKSRLSSR
jgi:hypothetical protein